MWLSDLQIVLPDRTLERGALCIEGSSIAEIVAGAAQPPADELVVQARAGCDPWDYRHARRYAGGRG